jgi:hypothetical protein
MHSLRPRRRARWDLPLFLLPAAVVVTFGCGSGGTQIESGAVLLDLSVASSGIMPDELRIWVYDDGGTLWNDVRVPEAGALAPESATHLGTVLIQPGAAQGALRIHVRGLAAQARVADGALSLAAGMRGKVALILEGAVPPDGDGDGVPDAIDDCPAIADADQHGCPGGGDNGRDGGADAAPDARTDGGNDVSPPTDGGTDAPINCDASGACNRAMGAPCTDSMQCTSTFCVDGVCCANACVGPCRSCNQPSNDGACLAYAQGMDPAGECTSGLTCNGAGACGPAPGGPKKNGELCSAGSECTSTFCADGVCCNSACDTACRTCETGTCANVSRKQDVPECAGTMTCSAASRCVAQ